MKTEWDPVGFAGCSGSGKTFTQKIDLRRGIEAGRRFVAYVPPKRAYEWMKFGPREQDPFGGLETHTAIARGERYARAAIRSGRPLVVVVPDTTTRESLQHTLAAALEAGGLTFVFAECGFYMNANTPLARKGEDPSPLNDLVSCGRHEGEGRAPMSYWWDAQRLAMVPATLRGQTSTVRLFCPAEHIDLEDARKRGGPELEARLIEITRRFARGAGERGLFVETATGYFGPYEIERRAWP